MRNRTSPEGHELGQSLAAFCDDAEPKARLVEPGLKPRCQSCAFRAGPHLANGSPATTMDALKCTIEKTPFYCHQPDRVNEPCAGWTMMMLADDGPPGTAPWDFVGGEDQR